MKKDWYKIGKVVFRKHKVQLHKESRCTALRTYEYYKILKGNWKGPLFCQLGKMIKAKYQEYLAIRKILQFYEVEGLTSFRGRNMLESQPIEESRDQNIFNHWLTKWKINKPIIQDHKRISRSD